VSTKRKLKKARADQSGNEDSMEMGMKPHSSKQSVLEDPELWVVLLLGWLPKSPEA